MRATASRLLGTFLGLALGPILGGIALGAGDEDPFFARAGAMLEQERDPFVVPAPPRQPPQSPPPARPTLPGPTTAPTTAPRAATPTIAAPTTPPVAAPSAPAAFPTVPELGRAPAASGLNALGAAARSNLASLPLSNNFEMFGDQGPLPRLVRINQLPGVPEPFPPPTPGEPRPGIDGSVVFIPSLRGFKVAENQTPWPVDRVYGWFNYFTDVNQDINERFNAPISDVRVYRESFGFEKTFLRDQRASISLQMPVNTVTANSPIPGLGGTSTAFGNLTTIFKYALFYDRPTGQIFTLGFAVTAPTGPGRFANAPSLPVLNYTELHPFIGYLWSRDRLYVQGFSAVDVPTNSRDVTLLRNSVGIGYLVYQDEARNAKLNALAPTFEVHVNNPLNHRGYSLTDIAGTPDMVSLTGGLNAFVFNRARLGFGVVTPVTGPRPFSLEWNFQLSIRF